jgi:hypothetical protein
MQQEFAKKLNFFLFSSVNLTQFLVYYKTEKET